MTMTRHSHQGSTSHAAALVEWTIVQQGLWVGKVNGEFAGMIETVLGTGFVATARREGDLGTFATIDDAKASFAPQH